MHLYFQVDCIDYYNEKEQEFTLKCDDQKVKAFKHTLGIAFVTFENDQVARRYFVISKMMKLLLIKDPWFHNS